MRNMTTSDFNESGETGETEEQRLSKSARKREAATLQELGVQLSAPPALAWRAGTPAAVYRQADAHHRSGAGTRQAGRAQTTPRFGNSPFSADRTLARPAFVGTGGRGPGIAAGLSANRPGCTA